MDDSGRQSHQKEDSQEIGLFGGDFKNQANKN